MIPYHTFRIVKIEIEIIVEMIKNEKITKMFLHYLCLASYVNIQFTRELFIGCCL